MSDYLRGLPTFAKFNDLTTSSPFSGPGGKFLRKRSWAGRFVRPRAIKIEANRVFHTVASAKTNHSAAIKNSIFDLVIRSLGDSLSLSEETSDKIKTKMFAELKKYEETGKQATRWKFEYYACRQAVDTVKTAMKYALGYVAQPRKYSGITRPETAFTIAPMARPAIFEMEPIIRPAILSTPENALPPIPLNIKQIFEKMLIDTTKTPAGLPVRLICGKLFGNSPKLYGDCLYLEDEGELSLCKLADSLPDNFEQAHYVELGHVDQQWRLRFIFQTAA